MKKETNYCIIRLDIYAIMDGRIIVMEHALTQNADKNLIFYGVNATDLEIIDGEDMLSTVRRCFFEDRERLKNRISTESNGIVCRCSYLIEDGKPLRWKKMLGSMLSERVAISANFYCVETLDDERRPYKKSFFDFHHNWLYTEFFTISGKKPFFTLTPSADGSKPVIIRKAADSTTDVLYPYEHVLSRELTQRLNSIAGEPQVFCRTSSGNFYFTTAEEAEDRTKVLEKLLSNEKDEEKSIPSEERTEPGFIVDLDALNDSQPEEITDNAPISAATDTIIETENDEKATAVQETEKETNTVAEPEETENTEDMRDLSAESFSGETPEYVPERAACGIIDDCPYEKIPKLIIESDNKKYYYFGEVNGDIRSGNGRTAMADGKTAYEGGYRDDKREGFGVYYYRSGKLCYAGSWRQNRRSGLGISFSPTDGNAFIGKWEDNDSVGIGASFDKNGNLVYLGKTDDGKRSGAGITYSPEKDSFFVGKYKDGEFLGKGTQFDSDGNMLYVGGYRGGMRTGEGISYAKDGSVIYKGGWKRGQYHGNGTLMLPDGGTLSGEFRNGQPDGSCTLTDSSGKVIYIGGFCGENYNGTGRLFSEDGGYVEGRFVDGEPTGVFNEYSSDGKLVYCGEWIDMHRSGKGIAYDNGVKIYEGDFKDSLYDGDGKLYKNGRLVYSGGFSKGVRCGFGAEFDNDEVVYQGMWSDDAYNGSGILYSGEDTAFVGCFENGMMHGRINEVIAKHVVRRSLYTNNILTYTCEYSDDGYVLYCGSISDGKRNGMGCLFNSSCEKEFEGIFRAGKPDKPMQVVFRELSELPVCPELDGTEYELCRRVPDYVIDKNIGGGIYTGQTRNGLPDGKGTMLYFDHRYTGMFSSGEPEGDGVIYMRDGSEIKGSFSSKRSKNREALVFTNITYYL